MIHQGDALTVLRTMPDESVQCCVTSPPYWGLRDYGHAGQIGLERTPDEYVARMVEVFREVRRVLKPDGVLWLNLGDSYATGAGKVGDHPGGGAQGAAWVGRGVHNEQNSGKHGPSLAAMGPRIQPNRMPISGFKPKDLVGIPWMLAFALRADGWWLRQDIIWHKPAPMPESVLDRCTKAHEYIFMLTKSERYYFNSKAIAEPVVARNLHDLTGPGYDAPGQTSQRGSRDASWKGSRFDDGKNLLVHPNVSKRSGNKARKPASARGVPVDTNGKSNGAVAGSIPWEGTTRNKRSVWTINTKPYPEAHFATFPEEIPTICILAGSANGDTVLDPFAGAGTVGVVVEKTGRRFVGIELNPKYVEMANRRIANVAPLFAGGDAA